MCETEFKVYKNCDCREKTKFIPCKDYIKNGKCNYTHKHTHTTNNLCRNGINCNIMSASGYSAYSEEPIQPIQIRRNRKN